MTISLQNTRLCADLEECEAKIRQAEEALLQAQADLAQMTRLATMGELTTSMAQEVNQPLTAVLNNANACLDLLPSGSPNLEEVREALAEIIDDATRAGALIMRVRQLASRTPSERSLLDMKDVVNDPGACSL